MSASRRPSPNELFAHALAQGETATEAYVLAGCKANDGKPAG
jgi:hypothetical protein